MNKDLTPAKEDKAVEEKLAEFKPNEAERKLLKYISEQHPLLSLLYDMDLMPEQLEYASRRWSVMKGIAIGYRYALELVIEAPKEVK